MPEQSLPPRPPSPSTDNSERGKTSLDVESAQMPTGTPDTEAVADLHERDKVTVIGTELEESLSFASRIVNLLSVYRLLTSIVLLVTYFLAVNPPAVGAHDRRLFITTLIVYLTFSVIGWLSIKRWRPTAVSQLQWMLLVDIFAIVLLMHASGGIQSGIGNLLIISVGATSMALPRRAAIVFAALGALAVLAEQVVSRYEGLTTVSDFMPAGALGATIFIITLVAYPLARRLRDSERLAAQRGLDLENLNELNRYIVRHLRESIVVIDEHDQVRLMNDSAAGLLGVRYLGGNRPLAEISSELHRLTLSWRRDAMGVASSYGSMTSADGGEVITPHFAPIGQYQPSPTTIFLEKTSEIAERLQQTKLAALGRLSASIAHEIRNPVGAISHASQLLDEGNELSEQDQRLTSIIRNHCDRVSDIIDSILRFSRRDHTRPQQIDINAWVQEFINDYQKQRKESDASIEYLPCDGPLTVRVDPGHLQQVLWNLCENASRYGRGPNGEGFAVATGRLLGSERPFLDVLDSGPGIEEDKIEHVFEPFFTHAADGTGLGLFIARELCECNRATLAYETRAVGGSRFRIVFADPDRWAV